MTAIVSCLFVHSATALQPSELMVLINRDDPQSIATGVYYAEQRRIPPRNVLKISLGSPRETLEPAAFQIVRGELSQRSPAGIEAIAITWTYPFRVGCMSITSAFALGYDQRYCAVGCHPTEPSPYFDSDSTTPGDTLGVRPTMMLAARSFENAKLLIDRGVRSDGTAPIGQAYLVETADTARNSRAASFDSTRDLLGKQLHIEVIKADGIRNRFDVMFYFTGTTQVPYLDTLGFLPGAIADHLTSHGGQLNGVRQMSSLRWLEEGATASYGTVVEPCNFPQKFPAPNVVMKHYLAGETAVEAYWKSVAWPGQGLFIGEPLARPYGPSRSQGGAGPAH